MRSSFYVSSMAIAAATLPSTVCAESADMFDSRPLSDMALADVRGTGTPFGPLTRGQLARFTDQQSRDDVAVLVTGRVQMDVWWGSAGSQLIANAVRSMP